MIKYRMAKKLAPYIPIIFIFIGIIILMVLMNRKPYEHFQDPVLQQPVKTLTSDIRYGFIGSTDLQSSNKWILLSTLFLNNVKQNKSMTINIYPKSVSNKNNGYYLINCLVENGETSANTPELTLQKLSGNDSISNLALVFTPGSGVSNNKYELYLQMANDNFQDIVIEYTLSGIEPNDIINLTNQTPLNELPNPQGSSIIYPTTTNTSLGNINSKGDINASKFVGDGSQLRNLPIPPPPVNPYANVLFNKDGNIGIGTSTPASKLHLSSNIGNSNGPWLINDNINSDGYSGFKLGDDSGKGTVFVMNGTKRTADGGPNTFNLRNDAGGDVRVQDNTWFKRNGNIGIGTNNPQGYFHLRQDGNGGMWNLMENPNSGNNAHAVFAIKNDVGNGVLVMNSSKRTSDGGPNTLTLRNDTGGDVRLQDSTLFRRNGNVQVNGELNVNGNIRMNPGSRIFMGNMQIFGASDNTINVCKANNCSRPVTLWSDDNHSNIMMHRKFTAGNPTYWLQ
jgi:hypothetical protein